MSWQIVRLEEAVSVPWRNGAGLTRELVAWPCGNDWSWRMSVAEVDNDGPFSKFDGVERWFAVLDGAGVLLDVADPPRHTTHRITSASAPFFFDGGMATDCKLIGGGTRDFNLMVRKREGRSFGPTRSRMARVTTGFSATVNATATIAIYALSTGVSGFFNSERFTLPTGSLAWRYVHATGKLNLDAGRALLMEIKP